MQSLIKKLLVFLLLIVVLGLVLWAIRLVLPMLGLPAPFDTVILIVIAVVVILAIANYFGLFNGTAG